MQLVQTPSISFLNSDTVWLDATSLRLMVRPAPCGADSFQSGFPLPTPRMAPSLMLTGMMTGSPPRARTAPLRSIPDLSMKLCWEQIASARDHFIFLQTADTMVSLLSCE